jgi:ComF family protein
LETENSKANIPEKIKMRKWSPLSLLHEKIDDLLWLVFPELCAACGKALLMNERCICTHCRFHLPRTRFHLLPDNPVVKHFWGKVKIEAASGYYYFSKGERVQQLIHQLKYKGRKDVGLLTGELYGYDLLNTAPYSSADIVVPVPLHPKKLRKRGYNQSDFFAEGIAAAMGIKFGPHVLKKIDETETQTRKHRFERFENVNKVFAVNQVSAVAGKHVLLVDDVVTTGSTLVSCAEALLEIPGTRVSIGAMACA